MGLGAGQRPYSAAFCGCWGLEQSKGSSFPFLRVMILPAASAGAELVSLGWGRVRPRMCHMGHCYSGVPGAGVAWLSPGSSDVLLPLF